MAKNLVAAGAADRVEVQLAYAIGVAQPVSVRVDTFGTGKVGETDLEAAVNSVFDLRPAGIISALELKRPGFEKTAYHGHFGREDAGFPWEARDKAEAIARDL